MTFNHVGNPPFTLTVTLHKLGTNIRLIKHGPNLTLKTLYDCLAVEHSKTPHTHTRTRAHT